MAGRWIEGQVPTGSAGRPRRGHRADRPTSAGARWSAGRRSRSLGIGVPGLYDPVAGATRFLVNMPGDWAGRPVAAPVAASPRHPGRASSTTPGPSGWRSCGSGAGRGASSMVGLTLGTGVGGVIAVDGRVVLGHDGTAGEVGHQTIDPGRAAMRLRQPRLPRGVRAGRPDRRGVRDRDGRGGGRGGAGRRCPGAGRAGRGRPLSRHRDRQHGDRALARPGRDRRRHRGGRRPPARPDPGGDARRACTRRRWPRSRS